MSDAFDWKTDAPPYRILINISWLTADGAATPEADWQVVPRDSALPTRRDRTGFSVTGPVATDQEVVTLEQAVLDRLADAINIGSLR